MLVLRGHNQGEEGDSKALPSWVGVRVWPTAELKNIYSENLASQPAQSEN